MRSTTGGIRPDYPDRNSLRKSQRYKATGVAPAADTTRWTYTVPSGKKARAETIQLGQYIATAAAPVGKRELFVTVFDGANRTDAAYLTNQSNTVGAFSGSAAGVAATLYAADALEGHTADASTGGTVDYDVAANVIEYDA